MCAVCCRVCCRQAKFKSMKSLFFKMITGLDRKYRNFYLSRLVMLSSQHIAKKQHIQFITDSWISILILVIRAVLDLVFTVFTFTSSSFFHWKRYCKTLQLALVFLALLFVVFFSFDISPFFSSVHRNHKMIIFWTFLLLWFLEMFLNIFPYGRCF